MTTEQNNTAVLTDEQLEGVAGGLSPIPSLRVGMRGSYVSISPVPGPIPGTVFLPRPPVGPCVTSGRARIVWPQF